MFNNLHRDEVFTAGGQPYVTYVERESLHIERNLARALATPNQIVSVSGPTKTGKTVLCKRVLGDKEYIWIDGGQISSTTQFWERVSSELSIAIVTEFTTENLTGQQVGISAHIVTASGSRLKKQSSKAVISTSSMAQAVNKIITEKIVLVIDNFHYMDAQIRTDIMRNVKGAVFNGMKVLLLSVTHRAFDAIKAEPELTGRFTAITLPDWHLSDLKRIPEQGFGALRSNCPTNIVEEFSNEAQQNPFLMQKFCWELCFDLNIERAKPFGRHDIPSDFNTKVMFARIAQDAGLPVYQKLVAGPQSRKTRNPRPLRQGEKVDIYIKSSCWDLPRPVQNQQFRMRN